MPERSFSSAAITGAAGGIGRALARQLAEEGTRVHLADIDEKGLAVTAAEAPGASS
ncbi:MAG TPA: SDR family NAD(P)-dependent oxidoreductase, partial [Acidimicrobiales bacterium]|nr:SDR family NAD(P)-dependent oxidoreductase [Acidimicrobiales bacterium]